MTVRFGPSSASPSHACNYFCSKGFERRYFEIVLFPVHQSVVLLSLLSTIQFLSVSASSMLLLLLNTKTAVIIHNPAFFPALEAEPPLLLSSMDSSFVKILCKALIRL